MDPEELPLRDIRLPEPILWWPPAPGWWIVLLVIVLGSGVALWSHYRHRTRFRRAVDREFKRLSRSYDRLGDASGLLADLSILMRRAAITAGERVDIAALSGRDWLRYLDQGLDGKPFSEGPGAIMADGPYRGPASLRDPGNLDELLRICRRRLAEMPL